LLLSSGGTIFRRVAPLLEERGIGPVRDVTGHLECFIAALAVAAAASLLEKNECSANRKKEVNDDVWLVALQSRGSGWELSKNRLKERSEHLG
jgi:hypothetical protein